jgi:hypothetical protein
MRDVASRMADTVREEKSNERLCALCGGRAFDDVYTSGTLHIV